MPVEKSKKGCKFGASFFFWSCFEFFIKIKKLSFQKAQFAYSAPPQKRACVFTTKVFYNTFTKIKSAVKKPFRLLLSRALFIFVKVSFF
jgi:hypothetical protein